MKFVFVFLIVIFVREFVVSLDSNDQAVMEDLWSAFGTQMEWNQNGTPCNDWDGITCDSNNEFVTQM